MKFFSHSKSRVQIILRNLFDIRGIVHYDFLPKDKQSTNFTIWNYWKCCGKKLDGNEPNIFPRTHESCTMKMHLLTRH